MKEIWKEINGYKDYLISNQGRVKSYKRYENGRILKPGSVDGGYCVVVLSKNNKTKTKAIHTLVWDHFGEGKRNGRIIQVDHVDEDKLNNNINNLQLLNQRENSDKAFSKFNTSSSYTGINWDKKSKKWRARILINGKREYLGIFDDEYDAHLSYKKELEKYVSY